MAAGVCPDCGRSVEEAGFLCDRCSEAHVAARPGPLPGPVHSPPSARQLPDTTAQHLARAREALHRPTEPAPDACRVPDGLGLNDWLTATSTCPCPIHRKNPAA